MVLLAAAGRNATAMQANPFFASAPPPAAFVAWSVGLGDAGPRRGHRPLPPAGALTAPPYGSGRASNRLLRRGSVPDGRRRVVDRAEHVGRDGLRPRRPVDDHLVEPPGDAAAGEVQAQHVAHVRPAVLAQHRGQLGAREAAGGPGVVGCGRVPGLPVRGPVVDAAEVGHLPRRDRAGGPHERVLVVLGRAAAGRVEERVHDAPAAHDDGAGLSGDDRVRDRLLGLDAPIHLRSRVVVHVEGSHGRGEAGGRRSCGRRSPGRAAPRRATTQGISTGTTPSRYSSRPRRFTTLSELAPSRSCIEPRYVS